MTTSSTEDDPKPSCLYFGFASNLSPRTLKQRCPSSIYAGLAILRGYKFVISELGFGNIVPGDAATDVVYGSLNFLSARDEAALDRSEEVPGWHVKKKFVVRRVDPSDPNPEGEGQGQGQGQEVEVMTYVDVERVGEGVISKDYIVWMRKAVGDGMRAGVPAWYFEKYVNPWLPEDETVGREEQIMMIRTVQMDKNDTGYVPSYVLRQVRKKGEGGGED